MVLRNEGCKKHTRSNIHSLTLNTIVHSFLFWGCGVKILCGQDDFRIVHRTLRLIPRLFYTTLTSLSTANN